jgi:hypothetical protein
MGPADNDDDPAALRGVEVGTVSADCSSAIRARVSSMLIAHHRRPPRGGLERL